MCDEYDDERMVAFWRRMEELERRKVESPEIDETLDPLTRPAPGPVATPKTRPRSLAR